MDWRDLELAILRTYMKRVCQVIDTARREGRNITPDELNAAIIPTSEEETELQSEMAAAVDELTKPFEKA